MFLKAQVTSGNGGRVYDLKKEHNVLTGRFSDKQANDTIVNSFNRIYYKYNQIIPFLSFGYNPDDGVFLGGYLKMVRQGFRKTHTKQPHIYTQPCIGF